MKKLVLNESIFEIPPSIMEKLIDFVAESEEIFFLALLKIISHFCFIKAFSRIKWEKKLNKFPKEEDWNEDSFLTELSWFIIVFPEKSSSFLDSVNKAFQKLEDEKKLDSKRLAEIKIIIKGVVNFPNHLEDPEIFLTRLSQNFNEGKENIQQILRELTIFSILYNEESLPSETWLEFDKLLGKITYSLSCLFQSLIKEAQKDQKDKKTTLSKLLILLYELKIIFSSEIIFNPEFCVD
ncbi:MAG: hypothetical protein WC435_01140 [Candidatus Paceibacterota bacterium]